MGTSGSVLGDDGTVDMQSNAPAADSAEDGDFM